MKDDFRPYRPQPAYVPVEEPDQNTQADQTDEPPFVPPYEAAAHDQLPKPHPEAVHHRKTTPPRKKSWKQKLDPRTWSRKQIIIVSAVVGLLIASGLIWWFALRPKPTTPATTPPAVKEEPKPTTVPSPLTGVQVKPELAKLPVTGVMIENSPDARPQAGLYDAGVVYEAIAEGGITRFLALFQEAKPARIGPVRSVRPYYLDFLAPFDAPIAHAGGSGPALAKLRSGGFKDLEAFQNPNSYKRVTNRFAPHNLYTSRASLLQLQKSKGWSKSTFTGFPRKEENSHAKITARNIDFALSGFYYNPHFKYSPKTNSYLRSMTGRPHTDENSRKQINPKVVIALVSTHFYADIYSVYDTTANKGKVLVFQDGTITAGTWAKHDTKDQIKFSDKKGRPLLLNPGQTWITLVANRSAVTYKP